MKKKHPTDQRSIEDPARVTAIRRARILRKFGEPPRIRSFSNRWTRRRRRRVLVTPLIYWTFRRECAASAALARFLRGDAGSSQFVPLQTAAGRLETGSLSRCRSWLLCNSRRTVMKHVIISLLLVGGFVALSTMEASAVVCARGVYRAGCVGAGRAVVVGRPVAARAVVVAPRHVAVRRRVY